MREQEAHRAVAAAESTAAELGLAVDRTVVLSNSNRLVVRITPCDVVVRVTPMTHHASADREVDLVRTLSASAAPVATLDSRVEPRVFVRDDFKLTFWKYFEPLDSAIAPPGEYAGALEVLHVALKPIDVTMPHVIDRVAATQRDVENFDVAPELSDADRALLANTLSDLSLAIVNRQATEQLLHGEPHPWNLIRTADGPLFIDFENTARGPIEYDLAWVPDEVSKSYPKADQALIGECRGIVLAIVATHRWIHDDQHPSGRVSGVAFMNALRDGPPWPALDDVVW
jgi:hypothetical protein